LLSQRVPLDCIFTLSRRDEKRKTLAKGMHSYINSIFVVLLFSFTVSEWSGCHESNDRFEPISVFSLKSSKFQVKDIIDSIVKQDTIFTFQELTDYIDTFILERSFCLKSLYDSESIKYFYYFSGDVKEWLTHTDSSLLILSYVSVNGKTYDAKSIKKTDSEKMKNILSFFRQRIVTPATKLIENLPHYDIRIIDSVKIGSVEGSGVICKTRGRCDTLLLKYIDGGKYSGIPVLLN